MKKILAGLLAAVMLFTVLPMSAVTVSAATTSGKTGECKWVLNGTKLTISGKGTMGNYDAENEKLAPWGTKVTTVTIKEGVTTVGIGAFYLCAELKKVTLPESVQAIGDLAFCGCVELTSVTLPENLVYIGGGAFSLCGITHITIPRSVDTIGAMAFYISALEDISIPAVNDLGQMAFAGCVNLKTATIGGGYTAIDKGTFMGCESLVSVVLDDALEDICDSAFSGCVSLRDVYYTGTIFEWNANVLIRGNNDIIANEAERHYECGPIIIIQPKTVRAAYGKNAAVSVCAIGDFLRYEWWIKDADETEYHKTSCTTSTYSVKMTEKIKNRRVICYVRDSNGKRIKCDTVMLKPAIDLIEKPKNGYARMGEKVSVKVKFSGVGLRYEWWIKNEGSSKYVKSSVTGTTYTAKMSEKSKNRRVLCKAFDKNGNMLKTESVQLRETVSIKTQPKSVTVVKGKSARVMVKASGDGLRYEWYFKNANATKYSKSSIKTASYSVKMSSASNGRKLLCCVYDKYGNRVQTKTVVIKMK